MRLRATTRMLSNFFRPIFIYFFSVHKHKNDHVNNNSTMQMNKERTTSAAQVDDNQRFFTISYHNNNENNVGKLLCMRNAASPSWINSHQTPFRRRRSWKRQMKIMRKRHKENECSTWETMTTTTVTLECTTNTANGSDGIEGGEWHCAGGHVATYATLT